MPRNEVSSFHLTRRHFIPGTLAVSPLLLRRDESDATPKPQVKIQAIRDKDGVGSEESSCGPQCVTLLAGGAAGVLLIVFLVIGMVFYRRREAQRREEEELAASLEEDDDWHFNPRRTSGRATDAPPMQQYGRGSRSSLSVRPLAHSVVRKDSESLQLPRKPSKAELAQMEVYRKMSVIGIV